MSNKIIDIKGEILHRLKFWENNIKQKWKLSIPKLILNFFPIIIIYPKVNSYIIENFYVVVLILLFIYILNEFLTSNELFKVNNSLIESNNMLVMVNKEKETLKQEKHRLQEALESIGSYLDVLPKEFLCNISRYLNLKNSERISLYVLDEDKFRIIGRYSANPIYDKLCRREYPVDCGYISKCLGNTDGNKYYYIESLPENEQEYMNYVSQTSGMKKGDIRNLSMLSRAYYTRVITDQYNKNVGILVIESINSTLPLEASEIDKKLEDLSIPHMITYISLSNNLKGKGHNE